MAKTDATHDFDNYALSPDRKQLAVTGDRLAAYDLATLQRIWERT